MSAVMSSPRAASNTGSDAAPLVRAEALAKTFDVSPPLLNRLLEGKPRQLLHAVDDATFTIQRGAPLGGAVRTHARHVSI